MNEKQIVLVCSPGGHLQQMLALEPTWSDLRRTWVTLDAADVRCLLREERVVLAHGPTNRSIKNLLRNTVVAWKVIRRARAPMILSTGAALAVPFFAVGRLCGCRLVYVESLTRTTSLSLSGRLVSRLADAVFVQWPTAATPRAQFAGSLL